MNSSLIRRFHRVSLSRQFLLLSLVVLVGSTLVLGIWLQRLLENSAVNRAVETTAIFGEEEFAEAAHALPVSGAPAAGTLAMLDRVFVDGLLNQKIVQLRLLNSQRVILYSSDHSEIGHVVEPETGFVTALAGTPNGEIYSVKSARDVFRGDAEHRLLKIYIPVHAGADGAINIITELHYTAEGLSRDIRGAQIRGWALVGTGVGGTYLLLLGLARRANDTIREQQCDLERRVDSLRKALDENRRMRQQLREAGAHSAALNEQFLLRVAADLHDAPAQDLALALMRFETLAEACRGCRGPDGEVCRDYTTIHSAMHSALAELRVIAAGLRMPPGVELLSLSDTVSRVVRDFERKTGAKVDTEIGPCHESVAFPVKITVFRVIQEALGNSWRHAHGSTQRVKVVCHDGQVVVEVLDDGPGFDPAVAAAGGRLGLAFMHERVRLLGGELEVNSAPDRGTVIRARLPVSIDEDYTHV